MEVCHITRRAEESDQLDFQRSSFLVRQMKFFQGISHTFHVMYRELLSGMFFRVNQAFLRREPTRTDTRWFRMLYLNSQSLAF